MNGTPASGWNNAIVVVAGTPWDGVASSERQLTDELARHHPIVWVDPPVSMFRAWRSGMKPRSVIAHPAAMVLRITPVTVPGVSRPVLRGLANHQRRRAVRRTLRRLHVDVKAVVVATLDNMLDVAPGAVRAFYGTDDYVAGAALMGMAEQWSRRAERRQVSKADVVFAVSEVLCDRWSQMGAHPVLVPNGTDVTSRTASTLAPVTDVDLPSPIAGYVGHISDRIEVALLAAVADRGMSVLLVGPVAAGGPPGLDELLHRSNVQAVGARPHEALRGYYRLMDVGLTPYADSAFNRASFPLKTLEYLAAGLPVVSTPLPSVTYLGSDLIRTAEGASAFADAAVELAPTRHDVDLIAARSELAAQHSWARRALLVMQTLGLRATELLESAELAKPLGVEG